MTEKLATDEGNRTRDYNDSSAIALKETQKRTALAWGLVRGIYELYPYYSPGEAYTTKGENVKAVKLCGNDSGQSLGLAC